MLLQDWARSNGKRAWEEMGEVDGYSYIAPSGRISHEVSSRTQKARLTTTNLKCSSCRRAVGFSFLRGWGPKHLSTGWIHWRMTMNNEVAVVSSSLIESGWLKKCVRTVRLCSVHWLLQHLSFPAYVDPLLSPPLIFTLLQRHATLEMKQRSVALIMLFNVEQWWCAFFMTRFQHERNGMDIPISTKARHMGAEVGATMILKLGVAWNHTRSYEVWWRARAQPSQVVHEQDYQSNCKQERN